VGDHYVVLEGLAEGEKVVVRGNFKIDSAMQILARPSMMSPQGGDVPPGRTEPPGRTFEAPAAFLEQLGSVVDAYLALHDALAGDDFTTAQVAAAAVKQALAGTDMKLLDGPAHMAWMESLDAASGAIDGIVASGDVEGARKAFSPLSIAVIDMVRSFGSTGDRVLHLKYCPMAFDGAGATWLQAGAETRNPYFGARMLTCAEDRDTFGTGDE
jgi:Cu(I)/Ag(I) efflux system membrane fusion protein